MNRNQSQDAREQNRLILKKAGELGITGKRLLPDSEDFLELSYEGRTIVINRTRSHKMPLMAGLLAQNKEASNLLFRRSGLPVPDYAVVSEADEAAYQFLAAHRSVVVKPLDRSRSVGVTLRVRSEAGLAQAIAEARRHSGRAMLQRYVEGTDFRVLVIAGRAIGALEYRPASIEGDGRSTIGQLIERLNESQTGRDAEATGSFRPISLESEALLSHLAERGRSIDLVVAAGERLELFDGGDQAADGVSEIPIDRSGDLHPATAAIAVQAAEALRLDVAGVDFRCRDIGAPLGGDNGGILEVNALPDMVDPYLLFRHGPADVFELYLRYLFEFEVEGGFDS